VGISESLLDVSDLGRVFGRFFALSLRLLLLVDLF
jgi:hypothetical protein